MSGCRHDDVDVWDIDTTFEMTEVFGYCKSCETHLRSCIVWEFEDAWVEVDQR